MKTTKKRLAIWSAVVAAALLVPATTAFADQRHHRHPQSRVSVGVGIGAYPAYGSYYYDPYYARTYDYGYVTYPSYDYGYTSYPVYGGYYYRYPSYRYQYHYRPRVGVYYGW